MKKNRKKQSRSKKKHYRQIESQRQRRAAREAKRYTPYQFRFDNFFKMHSKEIFLLGLMVLGGVALVLSGPDKKAINDLKASLSSQLTLDSFYWKEDFPYGYKVIVLNGTDIVHTDYDTLLEDLKINWKDLSVVRIQTSQYGSLQEKIQIGINGIYYAPAGISGRSVIGTLLRKKGASVVLTRLGDLEFVAEVVKEEQDQVFCLFGLR